MSHPFTDDVGYPVSAVEALTRLNSRRKQEVYIDGKPAGVRPETKPDEADDRRSIADK